MNVPLGTSQVNRKQMTSKSTTKVKSNIKSTCSGCGGDLQQHRIGKQRYCLKCHAAYMRENRPKHSELPTLARKKANARSYANQYLKRGKITRKPCAICNSPNSQMHHEDYDRPTVVVWLCRPCHLDYHMVQKDIERLIKEITAGNMIKQEALEW